MTSSTKFDRNLSKEFLQHKSHFMHRKKGNDTEKSRVFGIKYLFPFLNTNLSDIFCAQLNISELRSRCAQKRP